MGSEKITAGAVDHDVARYCQLVAAHGADPRNAHKPILEPIFDLPEIKPLRERCYAEKAASAHDRHRCQWCQIVAAVLRQAT